MTTSIWARIKAALTSLGIPLAQNTYIVDDDEDYPDAYIVYMVVTDPPVQHADNVEKSKSYWIQVTYFSRNGLDSMPNIVGAMILAGFTRLPGRELPKNEDTGHFGYAQDFNYLEEE